MTTSMALIKATGQARIPFLHASDVCTGPQNIAQRGKSEQLHGIERTLTWMGNTRALRAFQSKITSRLASRPFLPTIRVFTEP